MFFDESSAKNVTNWQTQRLQEIDTSQTKKTNFYFSKYCVTMSEIWKKKFKHFPNLMFEHFFLNSAGLASVPCLSMWVMMMSSPALIEMSRLWWSVMVTPVTEIHLKYSTSHYSTVHQYTISICVLRRSFCSKITLRNPYKKFPGLMPVHIRSDYQCYVPTFLPATHCPYEV